MAGREKQRSPRRWIVLSAVILLILAVALPPLVNIGRYHHRIAASISHSIGRPVHMSSVTLRLLPLPGFSLSNFVVEEEPEFGAEPILRADSVVAYPRLWSLWRGQLEIARISVDNASLNLVRAPDGSWNFGSILVQAARNRQAPTGQRYAGRAPRFPYIEATNSRINFKIGNEKKPLSFFNSDLSVWLESADEWGVHFRAQPVRTDLELNLGDTGTLRVDGILRRAVTLSAMPLKLNATWTAAPLGQLSRLILGQDIGWRGAFDIQAEIRGTAGSSQIQTLLKISGLHRAEFAPAQPLDLETRCHAAYHKAAAAVEDISCASGVGGGELLLTGAIRNLEAQPQPGLVLDIHRVPAAAVLSALQEVRNGLGGGLRAAGEINGHVTYTSAVASPGSPNLSGGIEMASLTLIPSGSVKPFTLTPIRLIFENGDGENRVRGHGSSPAATRSMRILPAPPPALLLQPVRLSLGAAAPLIVDGRFTMTGFDLHLSGAGALSRLHGLGRVFAWPGTSQNHLSGAALGTAGSATLDLNLRGPWLLPLPGPGYPVAPFTASGSVAIKNADLVTSYLPQPLKIASAQGLLSPAAITWTNASIGYGGLQAEGTLEYPALCSRQSSCSARFQLAAPSLDLGKLQSALLRGGPGDELLREILNRIHRSSAVWPHLSGAFAFGEIFAGKVVLHNTTGTLEISGRSMNIRSLNGRVMSGAMHLTGMLDASGDRPEYALEVQAQNASASALAAMFGERWGTGTLDLSARLKMSGYSAPDFAQSATGVLHWNWSKDTPRAPHGEGQPLFHFDDWSGDATVEDRTIRITHSRLDLGARAIPLSGTISFDREMDLRSTSASSLFSVTGTLEHPRVKVLPVPAAAHPAISEQQ